MHSINVKEARKQFASLVESARRGNGTTILRRGKAVARLEPAVKSTKSGLPDLSGFRATLKSGAKRGGSAIQKLRRSERY